MLGGFSLRGCESTSPLDLWTLTCWLMPVFFPCQVKPTVCRGVVTAAKGFGIRSCFAGALGNSPGFWETKRFPEWKPPVQSGSFRFSFHQDKGLGQQDCFKMGCLNVKHELNKCNLGPPLVPFYSFLVEGSPTTIDYRKKGTLILSSILEDLAMEPASAWLRILDTVDANRNGLAPRLPRDASTPLGEVASMGMWVCLLPLTGRKTTTGIWAGNVQRY